MKPAQQKSRWRTTAIASALAIVLSLVILVNTIDNLHLNKDSSLPPRATSITFMKQGELQFLSEQKDIIATIDIEVAEDDTKREQGLMYRDTLQETQGMLFVFYEDDIKSFWMKNTAIPLDMIFINAANRIVTIHKHTTPFSEEEYSSTEPTRYVLEVNAGFTERHKIKVGDYIAWQRYEVHFP